MFVEVMSGLSCGLMTDGDPELGLWTCRGGELLEGSFAPVPSAWVRLW